VLTVVAPIEGTPAYRAGIQPGDRILKIEGLSTKDMQLSDAVKRMRGKPGSKITISVVREGWSEPKDSFITREQIRVQSVRANQLEPGIEYIKLRQFQSRPPRPGASLDKYVKDVRSGPRAGPAATIRAAAHLRGGGDRSSWRPASSWLTEGRVRNQNMRFSSGASGCSPTSWCWSAGQRLASEIVAGALRTGARGGDRHPELRQGLGEDHHPLSS
jgi:carboxyl-terminal processing protease